MPRNEDNLVVQGAASAFKEGKGSGLSAFGGSLSTVSDDALHLRAPHTLQQGWAKPSRHPRDDLLRLSFWFIFFHPPVQYRPTSPPYNIRSLFFAHLLFMLRMTRQNSKETESLKVSANCLNGSVAPSLSFLCNGQHGCHPARHARWSKASACRRIKDLQNLPANRELEQK